MSELDRLERAAEAVLFAAGAAVDVGDLAAALGVNENTARLVVSRLGDWYAREKRGITVAEAAGAFRLATNPLYYADVTGAESSKAARRGRLTPAAVETLAIIAYRQPVTKAQIESVRGVDASHAVNRLVEAGLVKELGRSDLPGRPILFGTTDEFLFFFNMRSLSELPVLQSVEDTGEVS